MRLRICRISMTVIGMLITLQTIEPCYAQVAPTPADALSDVGNLGLDASEIDASENGDLASDEESEGEDDKDAALDDFLDADISQLSRTPVVAPALDVEVSTVSRTESTIGKTPAAVFVITREMIRRSGARSLPELLRLAPGVQVSFINSNQSMIAIRGSTGRFSNKLLVQIDGRSVYTPSFGGVFWDVQDLLLDDIERIEVIRGPGGTIWGANAVNGVINILTRHAKETQGVFGEAGGGTEKRSFVGGRVGGRTGDGAYWRVYGKGFENDGGFGAVGNDRWRQGRTGFRYDKQVSCCDSVTVQGDIYSGEYGEHTLIPIFGVGIQSSRDWSEVNGGNTIVRWQREISETSNLGVRFYYDRTERTSRFFTEDRDTYDFDFYHRFRHKNNDLIWGLNFRDTTDFMANSDSYSLNNNELSLERYSGFIQDKITIAEDEKFLWIGTKLSHNEFTGVEVQPNIRYLWSPTPRDAIWCSVSRAVRTPTRTGDDLAGIVFTQDLGLGTFFTMQGNRDLVSEEVIAYEIGYRSQPKNEFSFEVAAFFHKYENVIGVRRTLNPIVGQIANLSDSEHYGFELNSELTMTDCWRLRATYSFLQIQTHTSPSSAFGQDTNEIQSPHNIATLHSLWDIGRWTHFDLIGRYMDNVPGQNSGSYFVVDTSLISHLTDNLDLTVVGRNLLDSQHPEFGTDLSSGLVPTEVQRGVFAYLTYRR